MFCLNKGLSSYVCTRTSNWSELHINDEMVMAFTLYCKRFFSSLMPRAADHSVDRRSPKRGFDSVKKTAAGAMDEIA